MLFKSIKNVMLEKTAVDDRSIHLQSNSAVLFVDVAIQPEERFIAKQKFAYENRWNNGNSFGPRIDESTPCIDDRLMNCQTKLRINHFTAVKSFTILESNANLNFYT
ncbi:hypothetical protein TNCV_2169921 [Trichonephila clavipes]|nr:hypothetical protein TNCV_2169921 [Trichonephila clavipes]